MNNDPLSRLMKLRERRLEQHRSRLARINAQVMNKKAQIEAISQEAWSTMDQRNEAEARFYANAMSSRADYSELANLHQSLDDYDRRREQLHGQMENAIQEGVNLQTELQKQQKQGHQLQQKVDKLQLLQKRQHVATVRRQELAQELLDEDRPMPRGDL